tara:strand:- start:218 stop:502 length:285 start_codon:yes stop_codon:yes gene_type:complete
MKIKLEKFGPIISDKKLGNDISKLIEKSLESNNTIEIDFKNVISMATFCAKQIFGKLYVEKGAEYFFENIKMSNVSDDLQIIIKMGIQSAIEEK